jgi:uncharacterized lipoprotein (TIGR02269 family)
MPLKRGLLAALLGAFLTGCAATPSAWEHLSHGAEGDCGEEDGCVTLVCAEAQCGLYRCDETGALLARGTRPPAAAAAPGSNPRRNRGPVQHLPTDTQPLFTFDWYNQPSQATRPERLPSGPGWERHHLFPQEESLARWFARKPRNLKIHDFTMIIPRATHVRIHNPGGRGGPWNKAWRDFIEANPTATSQEVWEHLGKLIKQFELMGPIVPYYYQR